MNLKGKTLKICRQILLIWGGISLLGVIIFIGSTMLNNDNHDENRVSLTKTEGPDLAYILPSPKNNGDLSVEEALQNRRSRRSFQDIGISADQLSQVLWAAYGVTDPKSGSSLRGGLRTAPSAGALYPFEIYVAIGKVKDIEPGLYKYISQEHKIIRTINKDIKNELSAAALNQDMIKEAPVVVIYSAIYSRMTDTYGKRGHDRYVCIDLGHSAQNVYLQAEALRLGTCAIGAFTDDKVSQVLQLPEEEEPLYIMPIGNYFGQK